MSSPVTVWRHHKNLKNYLNQEGKIIAWTKVFIAPEGFEHEAPYFVAIVEFKDGPPRPTKQGRVEAGKRMPLQIVDCDKDLKPNQKIITVIRKLGKVKLDEVIEYTVKAKPI